MKEKTARGADFWSAGEMRRVGQTSKAAICFLLNCCEEYKVWPILMDHGIVHLIRKKPGDCGPQGLRPITVLVVLHRVWSIGRAKDFLAWYNGCKCHGERWTQGHADG